MLDSYLKLMINPNKHLIYLDIDRFSRHWPECRPISVRA